MADTPFGPGTVLAGRFTLDDLLDDTDGAKFWRATDQTLARSVAVHVIPDSDPRADALLTAARTSALVTDGHLLRVLDAAAENGVVYVVNEWGSGVTLDEMLSEGPLSPRRAAWVVKEVAEAIATAHRNGVAHGRLLPEKVMVTEAGSVKLIGFVVDAVLQDRAGRDQHRVTGGDPMSAHESDIVNLAGLLYAALVGRWPGTEGTTVPSAPVEHGRPLRPRQVRAGVPRPLDAICERVLNAGPHTHAVPIETAHEVYAALSDYIGDPTGAPQYEATTVLGGDDLARARGVAEAGSSGGEQDTDGVDTGDLAATGAFPAPEPVRDEATDAEQTQAGAPVFFDETSGVGWMSDQRGRGLRSDDPDAAQVPDGWSPGSSPGSFPGWGDEPTRQSAPPPPLPDHPERPLFADGPHRRPTPPGSGGTATSTGLAGTSTGRSSADTGSVSHQSGRVPVAWGPDADDPPDEDEWDDGREGDPGRNWLRLAAVLAGVVVVIVGIVLAFNLGRGSGEDGTSATGSPDGSPSASKSAPQKLRITGVTDFDPQADPPEENPDLAPLAVDGKPATAWQTSTYQGNPKLGGLKSGVGLLVDLGKPVEVGRVRLTLGGATALQILAAPDAEAAPSDTDGLDTVATAGKAANRTELVLKRPVTTQWLVVWLTDLPPAPGGGFQGRIAEISVSS